MANHSESATIAFIIKDFVSKALSIKYSYIISFIFFIGVAYLLNKFTPRVFEVSSIIGPIENKRNTLLQSNDLFRGLGDLEQARNLENDINNAKSFTLVSQTLSKMNLEVGYFVKGTKFYSQTQQIYPSAPFTVTIDKSHIQPVNTKFLINILDRNSYRLTSAEEKVSLYNYSDNAIVRENAVLKVDTICRFNEIVTNKNFKFAVSLDRDFTVSKSKEADQYFFEFYHLDYLAKQYLGRIKVEPVSVRSSLIKVRFQGRNLDLTIDFLNKYLQTFLDDNLSKKNKISINTINFIDTQISQISDSLVKSESKLKDYRSANQVMDLSYQGQRAFEQMTQIETDRANLKTQERYYNYVIDYINKNNDVSAITPPTAANVNDPIMNTLILDLLSLNAERSKVLNNNAEKNLFVGQIDNKIKLQRQSILETVKNNLNTLALTQNELNYRADKLSKEISNLPKTELNMVGMQSKFNLSNAIYNFLLQKRSEAAITMASNYPDYEILEPARGINGTIISPKTLSNWMLGFLLGLMIPTAYLVLKNFFNEKIMAVGDVENIIKRPVLNIIYSNTYKNQAVVAESPGSPVAESFRNVRSNLFMKFRSEPLKVLMVTSSQPRDGKSFISFNLAASIASVGYKTILLDCDLRRPTLHDIFKIKNTPGFTNYMADNTSKEEIIHKTDIENLYFIPAGPVLANSSELIEAGALDELIDYLRTKFEYVIIDTTPAGLVADASLMMKYASYILLVCRNNYTRKDVFNDVLNMFKTNKIEKFDIVFNDLNLNKSSYRHYSTYYIKN
jgi:tyrosine-protein kinase Etk/Wzc